MQAGGVGEEVSVFAEHLGDGVAEIPAAGLEGLDAAHAEVVGQAEHVALFELDTAAELFVAAIAEEHAEYERLRLFEVIVNVAMGRVGLLIADVYLIEYAESGSRRRPRSTSSGSSQSPGSSGSRLWMTFG